MYYIVSPWFPVPLFLGVDPAGFAGTAKGNFVDTAHVVVQGGSCFMVVSFVAALCASMLSITERQWVQN